ncbi:MAG: EVE domain-containing protein [Candidatus Halalkalibacterium sp. M3_1C_030]
MQKFDEPVTRDAIKKEPALEDMTLLKRFRLSITPVTEEEWLKIHEMAGAEPK